MDSLERFCEKHVTFKKSKAVFCCAICNNYLCIQEAVVWTATPKYGFSVNRLQVEFP